MTHIYNVTSRQCYTCRIMLKQSALDIARRIVVPLQSRHCMLEKFLRPCIPLTTRYLQPRLLPPAYTSLRRRYKQTYHKFNLESSSLSNASNMATTSQFGDWPADKVRSTFLEYFQQSHQHTFVPSSSIIPYEDPTLLFANAGQSKMQVPAL